MNSRLLTTIALALLLSAPAHARVLDLNLNNTSVETQYINRGEFADNFSSGFTAYFNDDNARFLSIDLQSQLEPVQNSGAIFGIGLNAFLFQQDLGTDDDQDDLAMGLGLLAQGGYRFAVNNIPTQIVLNLNYSPNILNTGEIDTITRLNLRAEFHVTPSVITYVGARDDRAKYDAANIDVEESYDSGAMLGFRFKF